MLRNQWFVFGTEMSIRPFLKWAGGKRWLLDREEFCLPKFSGRYIEPFLGGGAVFFSLSPDKSIISDVNPRLISTYSAIKYDWMAVKILLEEHQRKHCKEYYYEQRRYSSGSIFDSAANFIYLNRACWNGLYRENLKGEFNVPIGTKDKIIFETDDFERTSSLLNKAELLCCDFELTISKATTGDLVFVDPPYTTAHNTNGFVKYNQRIFSWDDQIRLRDCLVSAVSRGAFVVVTNAWHESIFDLYKLDAKILEIPRPSVISGAAVGRKRTSESLILMGGDFD